MSLLKFTILSVNLQCPMLSFDETVYLIGHNYHGHYFHAEDLSVTNYVRENYVCVDMCVTDYYFSLLVYYDKYNHSSVT